MECHGDKSSTGKERAIENWKGKSKVSEVRLGTEERIRDGERKRKVEV